MNKYNARKTVIDGITFDSIKEANRYQELKLLERAGEISDLQLQVRYKFLINGENVRHLPSKTGRKGREISIKVDFQYKEDGQVIIEDVKGYSARGQLDSFIKLAFLKTIYGVEVRIT